MHAYVAVYLYLALGPESGEEVLIAHETGTSRPLETQMDLANDYYGVKIAEIVAALEGLTIDERLEIAETLILEAYAFGQLCFMKTADGPWATPGRCGG